MFASAACASSLKTNINEETAIATAAESQYASSCPLGPQKPTYPTQFQKRNFSTGGDAYAQFNTSFQKQKKNGKKVINVLSTDQRGSSLPPGKESATNFTLMRKSHPQVASASLMIPVQKHSGDDDEELSLVNNNPILSTD